MPAAEAQTSGRMLFGAASVGAAEEAVSTLSVAGHTAAVIGRVMAREPAVHLT